MTLEESPPAKELRPVINKGLRSAKLAVIYAGVSTQAVDGMRMPFDFFTDIFRLHEFNTDVQWTVDLIDRAIGIYEADQRNAVFRTCNPFWWLGKGLIWIASIPFMVAAAAGFDTSKVEQSVAGKIVRLIVWLIGAAAAIVTLRPYMTFLSD